MKDKKPNKVKLTFGLGSLDHGHYLRHVVLDAEVFHAIVARDVGVVVRVEGKVGRADSQAGHVVFLSRLSPQQLQHALLQRSVQLCEDVRHRVCRG